MEESTSSSQEEEHNSIEVTIISAQGLKDTCMFGKMSPYALAWVEADDKYCTPIAHNAGCNPAWDHKIYIPRPPPKLELKVCVYNRMSGRAEREDPLLGSTSIPLGDVKAGLQYMACQLQRPSGRIQGLLNMSVQTCHSDREALESSSFKRILETCGSFKPAAPEAAEQQPEADREREKERDRERQERERERQERERGREQREREREHEQREREREQKDREREREQRERERERERDRRDREQREWDEHQQFRLQQLRLEQLRLEHQEPSATMQATPSTPGAGSSSGAASSTSSASSGSRPRRASAVLLTAPDILDLGEVENPGQQRERPRYAGQPDGGAAPTGGPQSGQAGGSSAPDGGGDLGTYYLGSQASSAMDHLAGR